MTTIELRPEWVKRAEEKERDWEQKWPPFLEELRQARRSDKELERARKLWFRGVRTGFPKYIHTVHRKLSRRPEGVDLEGLVQFVLKSWPHIESREYVARTYWKIEAGFILLRGPRNGAER